MSVDVNEFGHVARPIGNTTDHKLTKLLENNVLNSDADQKTRLIAAAQGSLSGKALTPNAQALRSRVDAIVDLQAQRQRRMKKGVVHSAAATLDGFLAMLLSAASNRKSAGYVHHTLDSKAFSVSKGATASYRLFMEYLKGMKRHGLVEHVEGFNRNEMMGDGRIDWGGREARFRATPALWSIAETEWITAANVLLHYSLPLGVRDLISFRKRKTGQGKKAKRMFLPTSDELQRIFSEVEQLKAGLAVHVFSFGPAPVLYRVFNNADAPDFAFNKGGRFYVRTQGTVEGEEDEAESYQAMKADQRARITIDGEPVQELDIKSSHPTILYALAKQRLPDRDLYAVADIPREIVKKLVTAMIGQGRAELASWPRGLKAELCEELGITEHAARKRFPLGRLVEQIIEAIPPLRLLDPKRMSWAELQFLESRVILAAMQRLQAEHGVPALPVDDSLIVPAKATEIAEAVLKECFHIIVGIEPRIERKH